MQGLTVTVILGLWGPSKAIIMTDLFKLIAW